MADAWPPSSVSSVCMCVIFLCVYEGVRTRGGWYCAYFRDFPVCKAVLVDIASMEERFLHSLRYTLINLLKPARPVSSTLTHQKRQAALNPTRIFSMNAGGKSLEPHRWQLSVIVCRNAYKVENKHTPHGFPWWMLGGEAAVTRGHEAPETIRMLVYIAFLHPHSSGGQSRWTD